MSQDHRDIDPDDFFQDTRMSFGDHIEDLRKHLWRAVKGFFVALIIGLCIGREVVAFISKPVSDELEAFYRKRLEKTEDDLDKSGNNKAKEANKPSEWVEMTFYANQVRDLLKGDLKAVNRSKKPDSDTDDADLVDLWVRWKEPVRAVASTFNAQQQIGKRFALTTLSVQEAFMVYFKVSLMTGFVIGAPWIFYQIWSFVAVGLYPHEKRLVNVYMPFSVALFIAGVLLCQFFVIPKSIEVLLGFNEWIGLEPDLRLSEWLGFAIMMPVVFGLSFQTPLIMLFIYKIGVMSVESFRNKRRIIWFCLAAFAAIITPSVDPSGMILLWVPLCLLFELGIYLCALYPRPPSYFGDDESPETEEVVEV
jgi:sec-independent protein translocase protein TatC